MEQRVSLITLGVRNLARSVGFYEALGWRGQVVQETAFFQAGGLAVVLWSRDALAEDLAVEDTGATFGGIALAHNVRSSEEVDELLATAAAAGAAITQPARTTFYGGYAGSFADPDGHPREVAHNPGFTLGADGSLTLPDFDAT